VALFTLIRNKHLLVSDLKWLQASLYQLFRRGKLFLVFPALFIYAILIHNTIILRPDLSQNLGQNIGTLHTGRYTNIGEVIRVCNVIPIVRENLGQTVLAANLGDFWPYSLVEIRALIHFLTLMSLLLVIGGLLRVIQPTISSFRLFQSLLVLFLGTYSLSLAYTLVNDSGNPLAFVGYADTLFGIFLVVLFPLLSRFWSEFEMGYLLFLVTILFLTAYITSPQTLLIILASIPLLLIQKRKFIVSSKFAMICVASLFVSTLIWQGSVGMLQRNSSDLNQAIPGTMNLSLKSYSDIFSTDNISPGLPYLVGDMKSHSEIDPKIIDLAKNAQRDFRDPQRLIWHVEQIFLSSLRVIFWPILGLFGAVFFCLRRIAPSQEFDSKLFRTFVQFSVPVLATGLLGSFILAPANSKWEMSRFLFPALVITSLLLVATLNIIESKWVATKFLVQGLCWALVFPALFFTSSSLHQFLDRDPRFPVVTTENGSIGFFEPPLKIPCQAWTRIG
jgi:hypothetical protein